MNNVYTVPSTVIRALQNLLIIHYNSKKKVLLQYRFDTGGI